MKGARGEGGSDAEAEPGHSLPGPTHQPFSVESGGMGAAFCGLSWPQFTHVKGRHEVTLEGLHGVTRSWAEGGTPGVGQRPRGERGQGLQVAPGSGPNSGRFPSCSAGFSGAAWCWGAVGRGKL